VHLASGQEGMIMDSLVMILMLLFGAPLAIFCFYGSVLLYYGRIHAEKKEMNDKTESGTLIEPSVSVVIPTHNEKSVIPKRIENLLASNYPRDKLEVIFVDDSSDETPKVIEQYMKKYPMIHLIRFRERMGYSPSLIAGCKAAHGDAVILAEASSLMDPDTIKQLVSNFADPSIGVATGKDVILNPAKAAGRSEHFYLKLLDFVRRAESSMDSTIYMKGEAAAVRRELITDLTDLENCPGTADTGIALLARKKGFRAVYDPQASFFEYAPATSGERVRQKVTRGANLMKVLWHFKGMFLRPKYGKFGMITMPTSFAMLALVPVLLLGGFLVLAAAALAYPAIYLPLWAIGGFFFLIAFVFWRPVVSTVVESEYSLLKGIYDTTILRKSHDKIDRVASTRRTNS
jgi:cellulose synthase/poly-beta-1,6-N-acetylglucosamine synthase-like glycosyltransferase